MTGDTAKGSDTFEPPKYLASLIAAVNDGAKAAQGGALLFALVGVYLLATAFSATDEDLLRGRTVMISQIGASLPPSFSFAIAPIAFLFLHVCALARYAPLAANVQQFLAELRKSVPLEADRERCRQLLANVEFIQALIARPGSRLYSPFWRWLVRFVLAILPVVVLLLVQINALRYQSVPIIRVQRSVLLVDLLVLIWFFSRTSLRSSTPHYKNWWTWIRRWIGLLSLPTIVCVLNLLYLNIVPVEADFRLVRYDELNRTPRTGEYLVFLLSQPIDILLCYSLSWGCRYLRVEHRTLLDHAWDDKAIADLRAGRADRMKALATIEGVVLRGRSLRFAVMQGSSLFGADLNGADLRNANLQDTRLYGAQLVMTQLEGANLSWAQLQGVDLFLALLRGADLSGAELQGAMLASARLQGADLHAAKLQEAILFSADLQGANLLLAQLHGADLSQARLQGASLFEAELQGADLSSAQLQGTNLVRSKLWRAILNKKTDLSLGDLQGADFVTPLTDGDRKELQAALAAVPTTGFQGMVELGITSILGFQGIEGAQRRLENLFRADQPPYRLFFTANSERQVLVSDARNQIFADIPTGWLITSPTPAYTRGLVTLLIELASHDPAIARMMVLRTQYEDAPIGCSLLTNARTGRVKLEPTMKEVVSIALKAKKIECDDATP
jgi:uncharacterized protein YjbI with pentapeptide repeats